MAKKPDEIAEDILKRQSSLESDRGNLDSHCEEIAQRMMPSHSRSFTSKNETKGDKRNQFVFDSTAAIALGRFAAILDSLLTPSNGTWHKLIPSHKSLQKDRQTRLWFEDLNRLLFKYRYAPRANFSSQNQQDYKSLGAYGNGILFTDKLAGIPGAQEKGLRYKSIHLGESYFVENHQGMVDGLHRKFSMTARQAIQKWGENVPDQIRSAVSSNPDKPFIFVHCVRPRSEDDYDPNRKDYKGMPFASYYVAVEGKKLLDEGGFSSFPYAVSRYEQAPGEVYGRGPAMDVLPATKTLNEMKKTVLKQGHRTVDPVLLGPDDGVLNGFNIRPGAYNAGGVTSDGRPLIHALPVGNIGISKELMDDERTSINDAFLVTLFQILVESPTMTATEVLERTKEKGILLAPTIGRQRSERLGPMIEREIDVLQEQGLIDPMPEAMLEARGEYRIEYDSPLSRAQRAEEAAGLMRTLETVLQAVNITQDPAPLDHINWDIVIPEISDIQGVPSKWMRSMEEVQSIRDGRAQSKQVQEMSQVAPGAAALIKSVAIANKGG